MKRLVCAGAVAVAVLSAHAAMAYVRTTTASGTPIAWSANCLDFHVDIRDDAPLSPDREKAAFDAAIAAWNGVDESCSAMSVTRGNDTQGADVAYDGRSVVVWRLHGFCDDPAHAEDAACASPQATATTTVFFHDHPGAADDGVIEEADIEINGARFAFDDSGDPTKIDLQSVLAHETGHALGLDHTCYASSGATPLLDDRGEPQPFCFSAGGQAASITKPVMYNFVEPGETDKRVPTDDETRAMCSVYATIGKSCSEAKDGSGGCTVTTGRSRYLGWLASLLALLVGVGLVLRRRRRGR
jgi:hypothetical protein